MTITPATDRAFSTPLSLLLGLIWAVGVAGGALMLWGIGLFQALNPDYLKTLFSTPIELAVRHGHPVTEMTHPGLVIMGLVLAVGSLALAIFLTQRTDYQN